MSAIAWQDIRGRADLAALEPEWWALWRRCATATPFQSPAWLLPWWDAFAPGELAVIAGWSDDGLEALASFYLETGTFDRRLLPLGISLSDYHDILIDADDERAICAALAEHMVESSWDHCTLPELAGNAQALRLPVPTSCQLYTERSSACPVILLPASIDALDATIPRSMRRTIQGARNRAARRGPVQIFAASHASALAVLDKLMVLHAKRWEQRGKSGVLADPRVQQFHRAAVPQLLRAGMLRLFELRMAGETVAVVYGFLHRERSYYYLTGFDPAYEFESPGVLLMLHAIEQAVLEGAREFHLLRGQESYKYRWGAEERWNRSITFERKARHARAS
jgi:CelD/BcsL family acetyltransferase involved in cellulose biosynthesis